MTISFIDKWFFCNAGSSVSIKPPVIFFLFLVISPQCYSDYWSDRKESVEGFVRDPIGTTGSQAKRTGGDIAREAKALLDRITNRTCARVYKKYTSSVAGICLLENGEDFKNRRIENYLVNEGFFRRSDFTGVTFRYCDFIKFGASGMVPLPNLVLIQSQLRRQPKKELAPLIAHEMVHVKQIRQMGFDNFACYYSTEVAKKGNAAFLDRNKLEKQAYALERDVEERISGSEATGKANSPSRRPNAGAQKNCSSVQLRPNVYHYTIENTASFPIRFNLSNQNGVLAPHDSLSLSSKVGAEGNACGGAVNYPLPTIRFESSITSGYSNIVSELVPVDTFQKFGFYVNNNQIMFGQDGRFKR